MHRSAHLESYFRSDEAGMCCRKDCRQVLEESGEITVVVFIEIKRRRSRLAYGKQGCSGSTKSGSGKDLHL
jgi:hypothetical protein